MKLALLALLPLLLAAQDAAPIRVESRLVEVNVIVRDKSGPVSGLTQKDFTLTDKGKAQKIVSFSVTDAKAHRAAAEALPAGTFSNRIESETAAPTVATVLLFDSLNTKLTDQTRAREQALKFLSLIDPGSNMAIYVLGNGLHVLHDFTGDRDQLARALAPYQTGDTTLLADSNLDPTWLNTVTEPLQEYAIRRRVGLTLESLGIVAHRLAAVPGRKNIIWLSSGIPFAVHMDGGNFAIDASSASFGAQIRETAQILDLANVALYPIDASGLSTKVPAQAAMPMPRNQTGFGVRSTYNLPTAEAMMVVPASDTMRALADWTGGVATYNTNGIKEALAKAVEDSDVTYTLGFVPEASTLDGKYHTLGVKVAHSGVSVRNRKGYFADKPGLPSAQAVAEVGPVLSAPVDATAITITADIKTGSVPGALDLSMALDLKQFHMEHKGDHWTGAGDVVFATQAADGSPLQSTQDHIGLNLTEQNYQTLVQKGLLLRKPLAIGPGAASLHVAVVDESTGAIGSLRIPIQK